MKSEKFSVLNYDTLFTGIFCYDKKDIGSETFLQHYCNWIERIPEAGRQSILSHIASQYYNNFINNVFPEVNEQPQFNAYPIIDLYCPSDCPDFDPLLFDFIPL